MTNHFNLQRLIRLACLAIILGFSLLFSILALNYYNKAKEFGASINTYLDKPRINKIDAVKAKEIASEIKKPAMPRLDPAKIKNPFQKSSVGETKPLLENKD